jgi:hypothetical protein
MKSRVALFGGTVALLVLVARWLAYALAPSPLARVLEHQAGGPSLVTVTLVSLGVGIVGSTAVVWLAALGVRERARLRPERVPPSLRLRRMALHAAALYLTSCFAFATFESYVHWRAGLGFHGPSCLVGPVHRNVLPLLAALSLLAAALGEALGHLIAWARPVARELGRRRLAPVAFVRFAPLLSLAPAVVPVRTRSRGPPLPA